MEAGKLRHRILFQSPDYDVDLETGERELTWSDEKIVWASIRALSGKEFIASQANQSKVTAEIVVRFARDVQPTWRAIHMVNGVQSTIYNIHGILPDPDSGLEYLKLMVSTGTNDGE